MDRLFNVPENVSAKESYEFNRALSRVKLAEKLEEITGTDEVIGARVIEKTDEGLVLEFGIEGIKGYLGKKDCDIRRRHKFIERTAIGGFINVNITDKNADGMLLASRSNIVYAADAYHKRVLKVGSVVTATVLEIHEHYVKLDIGAGNIGALHIGRVKDKFITSLRDYFFENQEVNLSVLCFSEEFDEFELNYENVRQPNGVKINTVIEAEILEPYDETGKRFKCRFPDFPKAKGIMTGLPKEYMIKKHDRLPVKVENIKKGIVITKF